MKLNTACRGGGKVEWHNLHNSRDNSGGRITPLLPKEQLCAENIANWHIGWWGGTTTTTVLASSTNSTNPDDAFLFLYSTDSGRYSILSTGELLIRNTSFADAASYKCQVRHTLTDELRTSEEAGRLIVTGKCRFTFSFSFSPLPPFPLHSLPSLHFLRSLLLTTGFRFPVSISVSLSFSLFRRRRQQSSNSRNIWWPVAICLAAFIHFYSYSLPSLSLSLSFLHYDSHKQMAPLGGTFWRNVLHNFFNDFN